MAHGITLTLREVKPATPEVIHEHAPAVKDRLRPGCWRKPDGLQPYVNPDRDRSLAGKARIRARKAARR